MGAKLPGSAGIPLFQHLYKFTNSEALKTPYFRDFMETSACRHDQSLSPFLAFYPFKRMRGRVENFKLLIMAWAFP